MSMEGAIAVGKVISELGKVVGRKRLQKIVHLLGASGATEFGQRFVLHYFGPFSRELARELDFLVDIKLVNEGPPDFEGDSYTYSVADPERLNTLYSDEFGEPTWMDLARALNEKESAVLEAISTLVFLAKNGTPRHRLKSEFQRLKPHLNNYEKAMEQGVKLDLLPTTA